MTWKPRPIIINAKRYILCSSRNMASPRDIQRFKEATRLVYGPLEHLTEDSAKVWTPPDHPGAGGHKGRYLWTDAFGVINFITLAKETSSPIYLTLAKQLANTVHSVLGRTRDGAARLPLATDEKPLRGGLRIGKMEAHGSDCDGQVTASRWKLGNTGLIIVPVSPLPHSVDVCSQSSGSRRRGAQV